MSPRRGANAGRSPRCGCMVRTVPPPLPPIAERRKPGLTDTLTGPVEPNRCQHCGVGPTKDTALARWLEHDENDRIPPPPFVPRVVVLCVGCSNGLIEPHPRLYKRLDRGEPFPGCMGICLGCAHRDGTTCDNPDAQMNGGPGLEFKWDGEPVRAHLNYGGGRGAFTVVYPSAVRECKGRAENRPDDGSGS